MRGRSFASSFLIHPARRAAQHDTDLPFLSVALQHCTHVFCLSHRTPASHSCTPSPTRIPTPSAGTAARKTPLSLSSAPAAAGLAALRRQQQQQQQAKPSSTAPSSAAGKPQADKVEPKPLTAAEKNAQGGNGSGGLKPVANPFRGAGQKVVTSR